MSVTLMVPLMAHGVSFWPGSNRNNSKADLSLQSRHHIQGTPVNAIDFSHSFSSLGWQKESAMCSHNGLSSVP